MSRRVGGGFVVTLAVFTGCTLLRPSTVKYDYYVLAPLERAPALQWIPTSTGNEQAPPPRTPVLMVGRLTVPDYLDRESMAMRIGEQQLVYSQHARWAEPLQEALSRTLRQNLALLLRQRVVVQPLGVATLPDYSVRVDVLRFERLGERQVELWARFTLQSDGSVLYDGETHVTEPAAREDAAAATAALSRALGKLSRDIAAAVLAVRRDTQKNEVRPRAEGGSRPSREEALDPAARIR